MRVGKKCLEKKSWGYEDRKNLARRTECHIRLRWWRKGAPSPFFSSGRDESSRKIRSCWWFWLTKYHQHRWPPGQAHGKCFDSLPIKVIFCFSSSVLVSLCSSRKRKIKSGHTVDSFYTISLSHLSTECLNKSKGENVRWKNGWIRIAHPLPTLFMKIVWSFV